MNLMLLKTREISQSNNIIIYSRFFLHTLDKSQESKFMNILSKNLKYKDKIYFEFRTDKDEKNEKIYNKHFRRFVNFKEFIGELKQYHFDIEYHIEGKGMAKFASEDAFVGRIIATRMDTGNF